MPYSNEWINVSFFIITQKEVKLMESFRKQKSGWKVTISKRDSEGNLHQTSRNGFSTKNEAREYALKVESKSEVLTSSKRDMTFADYFDYWYQTYKENKITESTLRHYKLASKIIHRYFGKQLLKEITRTEYQTFINWYGKDHAKETISKIAGYIRSCAQNAVLDDIIPHDFTQRTELKYNDNKRYAVDYLNISEINKLINRTKIKLDHRYTSRYMILTAIYTGLRLGEIMALTWDDIDFKHKTISVNKSYDYHSHQIKTAKTEGSNRTIRVNNDLLSCLGQLKANKTKNVFENNQKTVPGSNAVNNVLRKLLQECNINRQGFHFHSLRHSHVAYLLFQGVDMYAISKRLGLSNMTITAKKYAYLIDEYKAKSDNQIEALMDNLGQQEDNKLKFINFR